MRPAHRAAEKQQCTARLLCHRCNYPADEALRPQPPRSEGFGCGLRPVAAVSSAEAAAAADGVGCVAAASRGCAGMRQAALRCNGWRRAATDGAAFDCRWSDAAGVASLQAALRCNTFGLSGRAHATGALWVLWGCSRALQQAMLRCNRQRCDPTRRAVLRWPRQAVVRACAQQRLPHWKRRTVVGDAPESLKAKPNHTKARVLAVACVRVCVCVPRCVWMCVCVPGCVCACLDVCARMCVWYTDALHAGTATATIHRSESECVRQWCGLWRWQCGGDAKLTSRSIVRRWAEIVGSASSRRYAEPS